MKKNEIGGACGRYDGQKRCIQDFGGETRRKNHLEDPDVDATIEIKWIFKKWDGEEWTGLM
jgi:hypothetical protein